MTVSWSGVAGGEAMSKDVVVMPEHANATWGRWWARYEPNLITDTDLQSP